MSLLRKIFTFVAPAMLLALSACATGLPTQVSRFQAMPAPQGQSFFIQAAKPENRGGLEFSQYADLVRQHLVGLGYREASGPGDATFLVSLDYGVDNGRERVVATPDLFADPWDYRGFGYRPYYGRFYGGFGRYRSPFFWGWHDPFWDYDVRSYTLYTSYLDLNIRRTADNQSLFEGHAQARSQTNESAFELARQQADVGVELGVAGAQLLDLADGVDHRRVVAPAEAAADVGQRLGRQLLRQIHRDLARPGDFAGAAGRGHLGLADAVMLGDLGLDLVDRDAALVGAQDVGEHFLDEGDVDLAAVIIA
jgi:hypothetical protein